MRRWNVLSWVVICCLAIGLEMFVFQRASQAAPQEKTVVIVSTFADKKAQQVKLGEVARDAITTVLVKMMYFTVVERSRMDSVMEEMKFSQTAFVDESSAAQFGKKLGAKLVFFGNVSGTGYNTEELTVKDLDGKEKKHKKATATVTLNIRVVDVETNGTIFSHSVTGTATDEVEATGNPKPHTILIPLAVENAARNSWVPIQEAFPLTGMVIEKKKKDGKCYVYVDVGSEWGITEGRRLYFYTQGEKVIHPVTGVVLSSGKGVLVAKDSAAEVFNQYCTAKVGKGEFKKIEIGMIVEAQPEIWSRGQW